MKIFWRGSARAVVGFALVSLGLALVLGGRVEGERPSTIRSEPPLLFFGRGVPAVDTPTTAWFDRETGEVQAMPNDDDDMLCYASCSPWVKADGTREVVAGWAPPAFANPRPHGYGFIRVEYPSGKVLDQIEVPSGFPSLRSVPLWDPRGETTVYFVGGNGRLMRLAFEDRKAETADIAWLVPPPDERYRFRGDPQWLDDGPEASRMIVGVSVPVPGVKEERFSATRPWWIELDAFGTGIARAQAFEIDDAVGFTPTTEVVCPVSVRLGDNSRKITFLKRDSALIWDVCVARLTVDPASGRTCIQPPLQVIAQTTVEAAPAFSREGKFLMTTRLTPTSSVEVTRIHLEPTQLAGAREPVAD